MSTPRDPALGLVHLFPTFKHAFSRWVESLAEASGVSPARARLLGVLHCQGPQIMCSLGCALGVSPRNVTTLVDGLEAEGLVRRVPHPEDRRATMVELSPQGWEFAHEMLGPFHEQIAGLFRTLPGADQRELLRLLETLLERLQEQLAPAD